MTRGRTLNIQPLTNAQQPAVRYGRSRPSVAYEIKYRKALTELIAEMEKDVQRELAAYKAEYAMDAASPLITLFAALRDKWYARFDEIGREVAEWFAKAVDKRTQTQIKRKLQSVGWSLNPNYTDAQQRMIRSIVQDNVNMIRTIPQKFLRDVQRTLTQAYLEGGDREKMTKAIQRAGKMSENRAALIARDQSNKTTQQLAIANAEAYGATKGRWIHVSGKYSSRKTHIAMDGKIFDLRDGLYDSSVGRNVKPGELIYCNCQFEVLLPGFND